MPGSVTSVFSEAEDFEVALRKEGCLSLLVTGRGEFRARLTQVALRRLRLSATDEQLPRIALVAVPPESLLVLLPRGRGAAPIWGGIAIGAAEFTTIAAGQRLHMRTETSCRWGMIWLPATELVRYGSALTGRSFAVPPGMRSWRLRPETSRCLRRLHSAAIRLAESRPKALIGAEAAHGLEQQLIDALVKCLSKGLAMEAMPATLEHQDIAVRFDDLLQNKPERAFRMAEICSLLGISARTLNLSCQEQLGIGPTEYDRRQRMQLVHRALRSGDGGAATVAQVARRYGFRSLGRFAVHYRAVYGELPSATLRREGCREQRLLHGARRTVRV